MSQQSNADTSYDKSLRSFLDAISMLEGEATTMLDRFGVDAEKVSRFVEVAGSLSGELLRPLVAALGIADAGTLETLARDVRALMEGASRSRREQAEASRKVDRLEAALAALEGSTNVLAELEGRARSRLDALSERAEGIERTAEHRARLSEDLSRLQARIERLESIVAADAARAGSAGTTTSSRVRVRAVGLRSAGKEKPPATEHGESAAEETASRTA
jgi:hypothetical protein